MPDSTKPATGPLIMEQLVQLRADVKALVEAQERRDRQFKALSDQIDRFLAAEIDLGLTLVSVREVVSVNRNTVHELSEAARDLKRSIDATLALAVGDPNLQTREQNGH
jgi:hypothetical protein